MADPRVVAEIKRQGRRRPRKLVKAAFETGIVESGLTNPKGGDADSAGWRQERRRFYANPTDIAASVKRFYDEAAARDRPGLKSYELAADVQRPAAQYRGRYQDVAKQAEGILHGLSGVPYAPQEGSGSSKVTDTLRESSQLDTGALENAKHMTIIGRMLARHHGTDSPLFKSGVLSTSDPNPADFMRSTLTGDVKASAARSPAARTPAAGSGRSAVNFASQRIGHYIENSGANRGTELDQLQARFRMRGEPWCAIFATTAAAHGGASRAVRTASVAQINQWAAEGSHGYASLLPATRARPGDLMTFGDRHVGVVESRQGDTVTTIEGNTSTGGVRRVTRKVSEGRVARPKYGRGSPR